MRVAILAVLLLLGVTPVAAFGNDHEVTVRDHVRRDGTYVPRHRRTAPDGDATNNWSSRPNLNPTTGEIGRRDPYKIERERPLKLDLPARRRGRSK